MSTDIEPFADQTTSVISEENQSKDNFITNRLGMSNVRQALSRWWMMLIFGVLGYCGALYYMSIVPPSNEAVAIIEVSMENSQILGKGVTVDRMTPAIVLATEASKLLGPAILAETARSPEVQALQNAIPPKSSWKPRYMLTEEELAFKPASSVETYKLVNRMARGWLSISGIRDTSLIEVRCKHPDPETARVIADTLIRVYSEKEEDLAQVGSNDVFKILKKEGDAARQEMEDAEKALQVYVSALKLSEDIQADRANVIAIRQRYLRKHPARIQSEAVFNDLLMRFAREIKRSSARKSEAPYWIEYKDQLDALEKIIDTNDDEDAVMEAADEWVLLAQSALATRASLLNTTIDQSRAQYQLITKRMTEIDVADNRPMSNIRIIEPAFIGLAKDSVRLMYLAAGSIMGAVAGFCIAFALAVIDYKIYDVRSAEEASGLTCLAAIPSSSTFNRHSKGSNWSSVLQNDSNSPNAESIRNLRASIILMGKKERNKVLLVTSSIPGEGKTTISAEIASAFAMNKENTLLIDMDLRRPKLTEHFPSLKDAPGITEVLADQVSLDHAIHTSPIPNLSIIASGGKAPNPSELMHDSEMHDLIENLKGRFDRIIIDSAPVLPVADSRLLSKHVHGVLLVVRSRKTPIGAMLRARDLLNSAGATIGGVVVNGMKRTGGGKYHGYKGFGEYGQEDYGYYGSDEK
ncbi:polysaccharide biosynthesis tyrosine autokinase [Rubritalea marina]|uniref:polysaccharide biosynthesis tyrosine autokinase n=1 Tax=Rubritalea marina TaxID=361055 RepID=UPI00037E38B7|nr:tyrosine-protein kinase domain-containing protein [Rubritalea marina]